MNSAISEVGEEDPISLDTLLDFHRRLLANTRLAKHGGQLREKQNWIGGSDYRTGRGLIQLVLRRRGLVPRVLRRFR